MFARFIVPFIILGSILIVAPTSSVAQNADQSGPKHKSYEFQLSAKSNAYVIPMSLSFHDVRNICVLLFHGNPDIVEICISYRYKNEFGKTKKKILCFPLSKFLIEDSHGPEYCVEVGLWQDVMPGEAWIKSNGTEAQGVIDVEYTRF